MDLYFIKYAAKEDKSYSLPSSLQENLEKLGVELIPQYLENQILPVAIGKIPQESMEKVKSLEGIVDVYSNVTFDRFQPK